MGLLREYSTTSREQLDPIALPDPPFKVLVNNSTKILEWIQSDIIEYSRVQEKACTDQA